MKTLLLFCLLIVGCSDFKHPESIFYSYSEIDSIWNEMEQKEIQSRCSINLPMNIMYMTNGLGEITLYNGKQYIRFYYDERIWALKNGYEWSIYPTWFKDTCEAKSAYFDLLEFQRKKTMLDSVDMLRNTITELKTK